MIKKIINKISLQIDKKRVKCLVWDFDGTLYQNQQLGVIIKNNYLNFIKNKKIIVSEKTFDSLTLKLGSWGSAASFLTKKSELAILDYMDATFDISRHLQRDPCIVEFIKELSDFRHVILSNASSNYIKSGLIKIGFDINNFPFEKIFSRDITKAIKPNLATFEKVMFFTGLKPNNHLMVGDSYYQDIFPAQSVGMQAIHIDEINKYFSWYYDNRGYSK